MGEISNQSLLRGVRYSSRRIRALRDDLQMWKRKREFSQREFFPQRQSGTSVPGSGLSKTTRAAKRDRVERGEHHSSKVMSDCYNLSSHCYTAMCSNNENQWFPLLSNNVQECRLLTPPRKTQQTDMDGLIMPTTRTHTHTHTLEQRFQNVSSLRPPPLKKFHKLFAPLHLNIFK
jgi:hypothetical protein